MSSLSTPRRLLATDLDGTMVGHPEALRELSAVFEAHRNGWVIAYVTGRTLPSARALAAREGLPEPDVWVTEVGAAIHTPAGEPDTAWRSRIGQDWDRSAVEAIAERFPQLSPQPDEAQGPFKVSFYLQGTDAPDVLPRLARAYEEAGLPTRLVYSSELDLDIVPARAGKGEAVTYLQRIYDVPLTEVLTCGDSGNDHDMLCLGGPAVAVGNAKRELHLLGLPETVLRAQGTCAAGILEALTHYRWLPTGDRKNRAS